MVSALIVGINTYRTLAQASAYLADSIGGDSWASLDPDTQTKALISAFKKMQTLNWKGTKTGTSVLAAAAVSAGGTGYAVGNQLTLVDGELGNAGVLEVVTAPAGVVATVKIIDAGNYLSTPTNPVSVTGGAGSGATFTLTFQDQVAAWPRESVTDCDSEPVDSDTIPDAIGDGQIELANSMASDPEVLSLESTGSNIKRVKAGSAEVEFFTKTAGHPLPNVPFEILQCYLEGSGFTSVAGGEAFGTCKDSKFEKSDIYRLSEGYP